MKLLRRREPSNLVEHAKHELEIIGEEPATIRLYLKVVQAFADMGHSGSSAMIAIPVLHELFQLKPLSPITDNPDEWFYHGPEMWDIKNGKGIWQNKRNSEAFSEDGGKSYYLLSERAVSGSLEVTPRHQSVPHDWVKDGVQ